MSYLKSDEAERKQRCADIVNGDIYKHYKSYFNPESSKSIPFSINGNNYNNNNNTGSKQPDTTQVGPTVLGRWC
jgi:hypothetical protein